MNRTPHPGAFLSVLLLLGVTAWGGASAGEHLADSDCQECHLSAKGGPVKARMLLRSQEKLCGTCHPKAIQLSHPSGFAPKRPLPTRFPLDWKGDLTCASCHQIHGSERGLMRSPARGAALCLECHDETFLANMPNQKAIMDRVSHMEPKSTAPTVALDDRSRRCMECHNDKGGSATNRVGLDTKGIVRHMRNDLSHPVGRYYAATTPGSYRPERSLPKNVLLPDGKVGCVSCHEEGEQPQHGKLTVDNLWSALCTTCHVK